MRRMIRIVLATCIMVCGERLYAEAPAHPPQLPPGWTFTLPSGDAAAGKEAIRKMQCYSCHKIPTGDFPEVRSSGGTGPELVPAYGALPREFLAQAIIGRHEYMSGTLEHDVGLQKVSSQMGDYGSILSVRELLDIVEFLKHMSDNPAAKPK